jgi:hypothetical protein
MKRILPFFFALCSFSFILKSPAQITLLGSFDPSDAGSICGLGYDPESSIIWIYGCNDNTIYSFDVSGNLMDSFTSPGLEANDVDIEISPEEIEFGESTIGPGQILFVNGESDAADIFAIDQLTGNVVDTLLTDFGNDHVVGGSFHPDRETFFLVQDNVPSTSLENLIAEIDPVTGETLHSFQITEFFNVSYGDIEVGGNGNLFIVSSIEESIAEFSPDGTFIQLHDLPEGVTDLSGIALDCVSGEAWVSSTGGSVFHLGQFPCLATSINELPVQILSISAIRPNPFVSDFNFTVEMDQAGYLKLVLLNLLGQEVNLIYNGTMTEGKHDFSFSGQPLQKGIYILAAESNAFKHAKRIVCIR